MEKDPRGLSRKNEEAIRQVKARSEPYARLFATDDGKRVLQELSDVFEKRVCETGMTGEDHALVNARRDVMLYIREKIALGGSNE